MVWKAYRVTLRLLGPAHLGWRKLGNVQQSRPYVTGNVMWGAMTARITRDLGGSDYTHVGRRVDDELAFSYFYPSTDSDSVPLWPWAGSWDLFAWTFLGSYNSSALENARWAEPGSLHETEYIAPRTRIDKPVNLIGYIFERGDCALPWRNALDRLQLGGERGYGWGRVELFSSNHIKVDDACFGYRLLTDAERPSVTVPQDGTLLAHTLTTEMNVKGVVEPLIGRNTDTRSASFGAQLTTASICWTPGSSLTQEAQFAIGKRGVWRPADA